MKNRRKQYDEKRYGFAVVRRITIRAGIAAESCRSGSVLVLAVMVLMILSILGIGVLTISYGVRRQAIQQKNEMASMLAAEAGYEQVLFWMGQQGSLLDSLGTAGSTGNLTFLGSNCDYSVQFYTFVNAQPVYRVVSNGHSGAFDRTIDAKVIQAISGWDMGKCRIPSSSSTTAAVYYVDGETIDMPLHINKLNDSPDIMDIYISGSPTFTRPVAMGENRYTSGGSDKYSSIMSLFKGGIYFNQPDSRVTDEATVQSKINRFQSSTLTAYQFTPAAMTGGTTPPVANRVPAVQLEFFVDSNNVGKVRITNNCTVWGFEQNSDSKTNDFRITPGSSGATFQRYYIYGYHYRNQNADTTGERIIKPVSDTYVTQSFGGVSAQPGGQIYVKGNVIIGSSDANLVGTRNVVKGKITVVAAREDDGTGGNIWITNPITVDGAHTTDANGVPTQDNPNILGLIAQGVVKVVDPCLSQRPSSGGYPGPASNNPIITVGTNTFQYVPIGQPDAGKSQTSNCRRMFTPVSVRDHNMVVEAAITVGGGGWGAEDLARTSGSTTYGGYRESVPGTYDNLIIRGTLTEACRGMVGGGADTGYKKHYYLDSRLLDGILPGNMGLQSKYIATPSGWNDYRN